MNQDSLEKLMEYVERLAAPEVRVAHTFFRDFDCKICGACCYSWGGSSLDYFPGRRWETFKKLFPELVPTFSPRNFHGVKVYSDFQSTRGDEHTWCCKYLDLTTHYCQIHAAKPFLCHAFPMKVKLNEQGVVSLHHTVPGRHWQMKRPDGGKGGGCGFRKGRYTNIDEDILLIEEFADVMRKLNLPTATINNVEKFFKINYYRLRDGATPESYVVFSDHAPILK